MLGESIPLFLFTSICSRTSDSLTMTTSSATSINLLLRDALLAKEKSNLEVLISSEAISHKISAIGQQLSHDYMDKELTLIVVMKGAICLAADLIRHLSIPFTLQCIQASSYGEGGAIAGDVRLQGLDALALVGKEVLIVDDIFDSGRTLGTIMKTVQSKNPRSLKSLVLLSKKIARTSFFVPDYVLFEVENHFVVGYGLDYKEHYRGLSGIYKLLKEFA